MTSRSKLMRCTFILVLAVLGFSQFAESAQAQSKRKLEIVPQIPHRGGWVRSVAFSPDGARVLSGSHDETLKLWDVATGALIRTFEGHSYRVTSVAFSPDGTRLLSGDEGRYVILWDATTGQLLRKQLLNPNEFPGSTGSYVNFAFSADGSRILKGGDTVFLLWDATTDQLARAFKGHSLMVESVAFSSDGARILSGSHDNTVKLWEAATGALIRTFGGHTSNVLSVAFSRDGSRVLSGSGDSTMKLWDAATGQLIRTFRGHSTWVRSVAFSPDGAYVLSGSHDKTVKLWDAATGELLRTLTGHSDDVRSVAFSPDGTYVLSGSHDKTVKLWHTATGQLVHTFGEYSGFVTSLAVSRDGARVLSGSTDSTLKLWDAATGQLVRTFRGHSDRVNSVAFSPDRSRVLSGSADNTIKLWDVATGLLVRTLEGHSDEVEAVAFSPDGTRIVSGGGSGQRGTGTVNIRDAETGQLVRTLDGHTSSLHSLTFSPDGGHLLSSDRGMNGTVKLWDVATGMLLRTFDGDAGAFSPDGTYVLSDTGSTLTLWDAATGQRMRTFDRREFGERSVGYSPDGAYVVSGSWSKTLKLWDVMTGQLLRTFEGHSDGVESFSFSPDSRRIVSASRDMTMRLWDVSTGQQILTWISGQKSAQTQEWVVITPEGFFAASPDGADLLAAVRGLEVTSVAQVFDHLYRPDLIEEVLKGDPEGKHKDEAYRLNFDKILDSGPAPQIEHLKERDARAGDTYRLAVRITDIGGGIGGKVVWRVNGQTRAVSNTTIQPGAATDKAVIVSATLHVDPGADTIVKITAYNGDGVLATLPYQIRIDKFGTTTEERPRLHVLAIGVNKYRMRDYELKFAAQDATAFGQALTKVGAELFGAGNILVTTLTDEQVTAEAIRTAFDSIAAKAKLGDVFVLYLSGHGKSVAGRYYYYPQTLDFGQGQRVEQHGIGLDAWQAWIAKIAAQKKLLIIDTCESSAASGLVKGDSTRRTAMDQLQHATGENLIAAARQAAYEGWQGHGVLTFALLEAMNKREGIGGDDRIKVGSLADHVDERVPDISLRLTGLYQKPTRKLSGNDFPIGIRQSLGMREPTDATIPTNPTHVLIRYERVRNEPAKDAQSERELSPGVQVRQVKLVPGTDWAIIARDGQMLGYVPADSLAPLQ